ncbi:MAG: hypothetical protein ACOY4K_06345 [Pseudomonadota bacterium]
MQVTTMEILGRDGENLPILQLTRATRDALAAYTLRRWPTGRRKAIEREWGLSSDQARSVMEATASASTIDVIWKHPNGGWAVLLPVMGSVVGQGLDDFIATEKARHAAARKDLEAREQRLVALARDLPPLAPLGGGRLGRADLRRSGKGGSRRG